MIDMEMTMNKNWMALLVILGVFGLTACNTIEGAGEDVGAVGDAVSDTAKDAKN